MLDIDNVLADTHSFLRKNICAKYGVDIGKSPVFWTKPWRSIPNRKFGTEGEKDLFDMIVDTFTDENFFTDIPVMPGARKAVKNLVYNLPTEHEILVVSKPFVSLDGSVHGADKKIAYINKHFPHIHTKNIIVTGNKIPVASVCSMIIEDDLETLFKIREEYGKDKVLVCYNQPWNNTVELLEARNKAHIIGVHSWSSFNNQLDSLFNRKGELVCSKQ